MKFLGLMILLEFFGGVVVLIAAKSVFNELEGLMMIGFGVLTMATVVAGRDIVEAIGQARDHDAKPILATQKIPAAPPVQAPPEEPIGKWSR
jgi:hypothetical protein